MSVKRFKHRSNQSGHCFFFFFFDGHSVQPWQSKSILAEDKRTAAPLFFSAAYSTKAAFTETTSERPHQGIMTVHSCLAPERLYLSDAPLSIFPSLYRKLYNTYTLWFCFSISFMRSSIHNKPVSQEPKQSGCIYWHARHANMRQSPAGNLTSASKETYGVEAYRFKRICTYARLNSLINLSWWKLTWFCRKKG